MDFGNLAPEGTLLTEYTLGMRKERFFRDAEGPNALKIIPLLEDFHHLTMSGDYEYPVHFHAEYELIIVETGPYRCRLNDEELTVLDAQLLLIQPGDRHQDHLKSGQYHHVVHFQVLNGLGHKWKDRLFKPSASPKARIAAQPDTDYPDLLREISSASNPPSWISAKVVDSLFETMFWKTVAQYDERNFSSSFLDHMQQEDFLDRFYKTIMESIEKPIRVEDLSREMHCPLRTLSYKTKQLTGASPVYWIRRLKCEKAKEFLRLPGTSIKETAYQLGFKNPFHFSQVFKQIFGLSPSQWRGR